MAFLFLLTCLISAALACEDTPVIGQLERRARNIEYESLINDYYINDGWFTATRNNITYMLVTNSTLPPYGGCGALYGIYMLGDHPNSTTLLDGEEMDFVACLRSFFDDCDIQYNIKIRNCGGELQYYLVYTERYAGYCFDPPELARVTGLSGAPTEVILGYINLTVRLDYTETFDTKGLVENVLPFTVFECGFTQQTGYYYLVEWYADSNLFVTLGPTTNVSELLLTDDIMTDNNVMLGVNLKCGVSASVDYFGIRTSMNFSDSFFAGIVFTSLTMYVPKTGTGTIKFKTTLPIGCEYNKIYPKLSSCFLDLHMFERNYNCTSKQQTLLTLTGSVQRRCGVQIKTLQKGEQWNPEQEYNITIVTQDKNYDDQGTFTQEFITENKKRNKLWSNYRPDRITIIVTGIAANQQKYCYSHVDPHMRTADGVLYEQQEEGYFRLYRNTQYNIEVSYMDYLGHFAAQIYRREGQYDYRISRSVCIFHVQERTEKCNNNRATCTCAILVRAGADIVMFQTCRDRLPFIGYKACGDNGILQTIKVSTNVYQVHTPIGTYVEVFLLAYPVYHRLMSVNIHMSPKDFGHTEGLCGSYDNNTLNEFTTRAGAVLQNNARFAFSKTWKLKDNENYFAFDYTQLTPWSEENQIYCYCKEDIGANSNTIKTTCSNKATENCTVIALNDVTDSYCPDISNIKKRSVSNHWEEQKRRFNLKPMKQSPQIVKRSTTDTVNITESEANTTCADFIGNSLVATDFTDFLAPGEIEAKIQQCIYDVLDSNDISAVYAQVDAMNALVTFEMSQDPVYIANNAEQVQAFRQQSCPSNCSAQGTCVDGICQCNTYYHGTSCAIDERDQLSISDITGGGVCDRLTSDCTCYSILTSDLIQPFTFKYSESQLTIDGSYNFTETVTGSGDYLSIFEGIICFTSPSSTDNFVTHYNISISNDGSTFSQPVEMHVYDSTCQQYILDDNGASIFSVKTGYCNINGSCYAEGDTDMDNSCNMCQTSVVNTAWTSACQNSGDKEATSSAIRIIVGVVCGVLVCIVVIAAVVCILMKKQKMERNAQTMKVNISTNPVNDGPNNPGYDSLKFDNSNGRSQHQDHTYESLESTTPETIAQLFTVNNATYSNTAPMSDWPISQLTTNKRADSARSRRSQSDIDVMFSVPDY